MLYILYDYIIKLYYYYLFIYLKYIIFCYFIFYNLDNNKNVNGNIENLFDSDTSLSSISAYESDNISEDNEDNETIKSERIIMNLTQDEKKNKTTDVNSHKNGINLDDTSSMTSLSSLDNMSPSSIPPLNSKRKLRSRNKTESINNDSFTSESNSIPKRKRRRKSSNSSLSTLQSPNNIAIPNNIEQVSKRRGRKRKITKFNYSYEKLLQINVNKLNLNSFIYNICFVA